MSATLWNVPPPTYDFHSAPTSYFAMTLTPYLTLPHLLSLTWLAAPILSLIFVAFRLQLSLADAQNALDKAKVDMLASCVAAEQAATAAASMPRYMALATNKQFAEAINGSMEAARTALTLSLTVMEAVINFIVDLYRSTFLCLLELVVRGGLQILIGAVQELNGAIQTVASGLRTSLQSDIASANNIIQSAVDAVNKINPFSKITAPHINVPSLDSLQNVTLPSSFQDSLVKLNATIPSASNIKQKIESVIDTPFELLKKDINDTFLGLSFQPDGLPVPAQSRVSFCNQLDTSVVDDLGHDMIRIAKIGVVLLIVLALVLIGLNCLLTWYRWITLKRHLEYTRQAWSTDPTIIHANSSGSSPQITLSDHNLMLLRADSEHPLITKIMNQLSAKFRLTPKQHTHTRWFLHYIFYTPALACFLIGFFGLLSVELQLLAMGPLVAKYRTRAQSTVSNFNGLIATSINATMYNQSAFYANAVNSRVDDIQTEINNGVFGWVNGTTTTLNNTINEFYTDVQNAVTLVFGGTILETPAQEFIKCFIGGKVDAIEAAITFLHDNLHVNMPRVNDTVLILSPDSVDEATRPIAAAAIGDGTGDNQGFLGKVIQAYVASLKKERVMFGIFMALWGVVVLMGLAVVLWHSFGKPYLEKRKKKKYEQEQRSGLEGFSLDNEKGSRKDVKFNALSPPKRTSFKPFWLSAKPSSQSGTGSSSSEESLDNDRHWETAFAEATPQPLRRKQTRASKLLAVGRNAFNREPRSKDGEDEEAVQSPVQHSEPPVDHRDGAWYNKMTSLLTGRKKDGNQESELMSDEQDQSRPRPNLQIFTQHATVQQEPSRRESEQVEGDFPARSRFSTSPGAVQTSWKHLISPPKKLKHLPPPLPMPTTPIIVVTEELATPLSPPPKKKRSTSGSYQPPIGLPIRKPNQTTPDVTSPVSEDPFRAQSTTAPIPLHAGFHNRYNQSSQKGAASQSMFSPPVITSPNAIQYQTPLAPPPASRYPTPKVPPKSPERHRKSVSLGGQEPSTPRWRVTNAVPGDSVSASSNSLSTLGSKNGSNDQSKGRDEGPFNNVSVPPMTGFLPKADAKKSSLNPFITPFDDEHRVRIDGPGPEGLRKSMQTGPVAY